MTQLELSPEFARLQSENARLRAELDERLQAEQAQAPHWREPHRKYVHLPPPPAPDYRAWLGHLADCTSCTRAREDLTALRMGDLEAEPVVPCPVGLRMMPLEELVLADGGRGWDRSDLQAMMRRLIAYCRSDEGRGPDMHIGVAWSGERCDVAEA